MRKKIVAGNWKMNKNLEETKSFFENLNLIGSAQTEIIIAVPFPYLNFAIQNKKSQKISIAAQNAHPKNNGAFTGEVSFEMLSDLGVEFCLIGHSERREMFGDTLHFVREKVEASIAKNIKPILCVGETLNDRNANNHFDIVKEQILHSLENISEANFNKVVIAYEPVWAIGTGQTASSKQVQEMHAFIRKILTGKYDNLAFQTQIIYGGSCKPSNAAELFAQPDVDGGLIGGASLDTKDFEAIIEAAN